MPRSGSRHVSTYSVNEGPTNEIRLLKKADLVQILGRNKDSPCFEEFAPMRTTCDTTFLRGLCRLLIDWYPSRDSLYLVDGT